MASNVAWAAKIVDAPPSVMNPKGFASEIKGLFKGNKQVAVKEIQGSKLQDEGLNGVYAVGQAATEAPRIVILDYKPNKPEDTVALIGKGVTYDTGGLSLKISWQHGWHEG